MTLLAIAAATGRSCILFAAETGDPLERIIRLDDAKDGAAAETEANAILGSTKSPVALAGLARALHLQERFAEAETAHRAAIQALPAPGLSTKTLARIYYNYAETLRALERWSDAEPLAREALRLNRAGGQDRAAIADSEVQLAIVSLSLEKLDEAETFLASALQSRTELLGPTSRKTINVQAWLAQTRLRQGRPDQGIAILKQVYRERLTARDPIDIAEAASDLAAAIEDSGRAAEAEEFRRAALASPEGLDAEFGAWLQADLGINLAKQRRNEEAEPLLRSAVQRLSKIEGLNDVDLVEPLDWLSATVVSLGRADEGLSLLDRLLQAQEAAGGPNAPELIDTLVRQAALLAQLGRAAEAEPVLRRARASAASSEALLIARVERQFAVNYYVMGKLSEANAAADRALVLLRGRSDSLDLAHALILKGAVAALEFRDADRVAHFRQALAIRRQVLGWASSETYTLAWDVVDGLRNLRRWTAAEEAAREVSYALAGSGNKTAHSTSLGKLANILVEQQRWGDAEPILEELMDAAADGDAIEYRVNAANAMVGMAKLKEANGDLASSELLLRQSLNLWKGIGPEGIGRRNIAAVQRHLSAILLKQRKLDEAVPLLREARKTFQELEGSISNNAAWATTSLAKSLASLGEAAAADQLFNEAINVHGKAGAEVDLLEALEGHASLSLHQRNEPALALQQIRRASQIANAEAAAVNNFQAYEQLRRRRSIFELHVQTSWKAASGSEMAR